METGCINSRVRCLQTIQMYLNWSQQPFASQYLLTSGRRMATHTPYTQTPYKLSKAPYMDSFHYDDDPTACSRLFILPLSPRLTTPKEHSFLFPSFDIRARTVGDLMGAFTHLQEEQKTPFGISIRIPSIREYQPFSNIIKAKVLDISSVQSQKSQQEASFLKGVRDLQNPSSVTNSQQSQHSVFMDLELLGNYQPPEYSRVKLWEDEEIPFSSQGSLIYSEIIARQTGQLNQGEVNFFELEPRKILEQDLIHDLVLALQGIEGELMIMEYEGMTWRIRPSANFSLSFYFKQSVANYVSGILEVATMRCRIEVALAYIRVQQNKKQIYKKMSQIYFSVILCLDAILMEALESHLTFLQFHTQMQPLRAELKLIVGFLLRDDASSGSFYDFNRSYLLTQADIFSRVSQKLVLNDFCEQKEKQLIRRVGLECFKVILHSLNIFLHYKKEEWESSQHHHFYLGLYFEQRKEYVNKIIDRLNTIHQDDLEIYNICKENHDMQLLLSYSQLRLYEHKWRRQFKAKAAQLRLIGKRIENDRQRRLQESIDKKALEIAEMKVRLMQRVQQSSRLKAEQREKQKRLIEDLQVEIQQKVEARKLLKLIEIQKEKGYLLDIELKERDELMSKKYKALQDHPQLIGKMMEIESEAGNSRMEVETDTLSEGQSRGKPFSNDSLPPVTMAYNPHSNASQQPEQKQHLSLKKAKSAGQQSYQKKISIRSQLNVEEIEENQLEQLDNEAQLSPMLSEISIQVPIKTCLDICIDGVVQGQAETLNEAYRTILYHKYRVDWIFQFLHKFILSANGQPLSQLLDLAVSMHSTINISYLKDYFFDDSIREEITRLEPVFSRADGNAISGSVNLIQEPCQRSLEFVVGFEFRSLPEILKPIFNYTHMGKYVQIFCFVIRLRHCEQLIQQQWKSLQIFERQSMKTKDKRVDKGLLKSLLDTRHKIQCFFNIFQNHFFWHVVEKEFQLIRTALRNKEIDSLQQIHNKFLERVCLRGFIQTQHEIASRFKKTFFHVREFHNIVTQFCSDDIPSYNARNVRQRVKKISEEFLELHNILHQSMN